MIRKLETDTYKYFSVKDVSCYNNCISTVSGTLSLSIQNARHVKEKSPKYDNFILNLRGIFGDLLWADKCLLEI